MKTESLKFNEYKVTFDKRGKILTKELTKRKSVMISKIDADEMNTATKATKLYYEQAKEPKK